MRIRFSIPGRPRGWARATPLADGRAVTPKWMREYKLEIIRIFREKFPGLEPWAGPVMLRMTAIFATPKHFSAALRESALEGKLYYTGKSDHDNIQKMVGDALNGIAWVDDCQISGGCIKRYGEVERTDVDIEFIEGHPITPSEHRRTVKQAQGKLFPDPPKKKRRRSLTDWGTR